MAVNFDLRGRSIGGYQVIDVLGAGAMGIVYRAKRGRKTVVIKTIRPDVMDDAGKQRFMREAEVTKKLHHKHIVRTYSYGVEHGIFYMVSEFMAGGNLGMYLASRRRVTIREALRILRDLAKGLDYAHGKGYVHRDLKPDNVLVSERGVPKIGDFGLVMVADQATRGHAGLNLTVANQGMGTPLYVSPEQFVSARDVDKRADLYSFAAMAYHIIIGMAPSAIQSAKNEEQLQLALIQGLIYLPSSIDPQWMVLDKVMLQALSADPNERYPSALAFVEALETVLKPKRNQRINTRDLTLGGAKPLTDADIRRWSQSGRGMLGRLPMPRLPLPRLGCGCLPQMLILILILGFLGVMGSIIPLPREIRQAIPREIATYVPFDMQRLPAESFATPIHDIQRYALTYSLLFAEPSQAQRDLMAYTRTRPFTIDLTGKDNVIEWENLTGTYRDFIVGAMVTWGRGATEDTCGFRFRVTNRGYYIVQLDRNGQAKFNRRSQNAWNDPQVVTVRGLNTVSGGSNRVVLLVSGGTFTIYANGSYLAAFRDNTFEQGGTVSVTAETFNSSEQTGCTFHDVWVHDLS